MKKIFITLGLVGFYLLFVPVSSAQSFFDEEANSSLDELYEENATGNKPPMTLPTIREADVLWQKTIWREIDFRQKMNQGFYYPEKPHQNWKNLYSILKDALADPSTGVIAYKDETTGELLNPISWDEIEKSITNIQNVDEYDDFGNVIGTKQVSSEMRSTEVLRCQIKEIWYFDKQRSQMLVKILAICPIKMVEKNGEMVAERLFWIPYDENLRNVLVKAPFYNRNNSAMELSYDDVFSKRIFDSYIIKEENIFDRNINSYAKGVEAMKESERIKQEIIDFEQNLWEY